MSVFVRCRKCSSFHSYRKECKCGYRGKEKSYYVQHKADGKFKLAFASNSLAEARELDARYKYEMNVQKRLHLSFSAYLDKYFIPHYLLNKTGRTRLWYIERFRKAFGDMALDKIKPSLIELTVIDLAEGRSVSTFNEYVKIIHRIFQYAIEVELMDKNPAKVRRRRGEVIRKRFLNEQEREILLEECKKSKSPQLYQMAYISLFSGMRYGEIRKLRREDIRDGCIYVPEENSKNKKSRAIPLKKELADFFETGATCDYDYEVRGTFRRAVKATGLKDVRFHDLRRTFGSMLAQAGVPILHISKLLGHSNVQITAAVYAHLIPDNLKSAVDMLKM